MKYLVTGAGGFIGSHVCDYLASQKDNEVTAVGRFTLDKNSDKLRHVSTLAGMTLPDARFEALIKKCQPDVLVHCAGMASVKKSMELPYTDFQRNVDLCAYTLDMLRFHAPECKFIFLSSAAVYGNPSVLPIDESFISAPISAYAFHKQMCETLVREYSELFGIRYAILRVFSAYGERLNKQILYDLCRKMTDPDLSEVQVIGTGNESRDFIHAQDIAQAIQCISTVDSYPVVNVANGIQIKISEVVDLLYKNLNCDKAVVYTGVLNSGDPVNWQADISKLIDIKYHSTIGLEQGILNYCNWFLNKAKD